MSKIFVVDSVMGSGKTTATINYINSMASDIHFIYVAPYLSEVRRIMDSCSQKNVLEPHYIEGRKINGLYKLLEDGRNIVTTHALFERIEKRGIDLIKKYNYVCFIDETLNCIAPYDAEGTLTKCDLRILISSSITADDETGIVSWRDKDYSGMFYVQKELADNKRLAYYDESTLVQLFPIDVFTAFREIYVLTYLFEGSIMSCYLKYFNLDYSNLYVTGNDISNFFLSCDKDKERKPNKNYRELIHILDNNKMNSIGDNSYALSYSWYFRKDNNESLEVIRKHLLNYFQNILKCKSSECIWTTFEGVKKKIAPKGYSRGFVAINMRASNDYSDRTVIGYTVNRFINTITLHFLRRQNIEPDQDLFALSEMLQFIWRSAIRNDKSIDIYIPSSRMRKLLMDWIEENSVE